MTSVRPELVIQGFAVHSNPCEGVPQIHAAGMGLNRHQRLTYHNVLYLSGAYRAPGEIKPPGKLLGTKKQGRKSSASPIL